MDITKQKLLDNYLETATSVLEANKEYLAEEQPESQTYWFAKSCQIGLGLVQSAPDPIMHNSETLIIDTWGWIPPDVREQMKNDNHPLAEAVQELGGE